MISYWSRSSDTLRGWRALLRSARSISFSQYSEDALVYGLIPLQRGFYIDVGAYHPWHNSNTYKLYLRGWSGLTIEPNPDIAPLFRRMRPRDIHLTMGVAAQAGELDYFRFKEPKLNSFRSEQQDWMGQVPTSTIRVECRPLQEIIDRHAAGRTIDLISIDCEGLDLAALETLDWDKNRPCAVIVEDLEQFILNNESTRQSAIRSFLAARQYALISQAAFSFIYVDVTAFGAKRDTGFYLDQSQFGVVKRDGERQEAM
jgi:FkbM family methyltransferase